MFYDDDIVSWNWNSHVETADCSKTVVVCQQESDADRPSIGQICSTLHELSYSPFSNRLPKTSIVIWKSSTSNPNVVPEFSAVAGVRSDE
jgi:hypothetical protein